MLILPRGIGLLVWELLPVGRLVVEIAGETAQIQAHIVDGIQIRLPTSRVLDLVGIFLG